MKTINRYKGIIFSSAIIAGIVISGCKKEFLEVNPTDQTSSSEVFSSEAKIAAAMTGIYNLTTFSGYTNNMLLSVDVKGGDVMIVSGAGNYNWYTSQYQFAETVNTTEPEEYWSYAYKVISNANQFVVNIPGSPIAEARKATYLAEARAKRAEAYFWLIRWYAKPYSVDPEAFGVPIIRQPLGPNDAPPGRDKVKDVYAFILEDFKYAEENLGEGTTIYRMNVQAVQGYLARIYLTMGNWAEASRYAKLARQGSPLSSGEELLEGFNNPTSEWIYAINVRTDDNQGFRSVASFFDPYDIGYSSFRATDEFFNSFSDDDIRKGQFLVKSDPDADPSTAEYRRRGPQGWLINKFDFTSTPANNQVMIRSSEMYLIEAEAEARLGNETPAKQALLAIQGRAGVTTVISPKTGTALIEEILTERAKELYGEGHKFFDLLRNKKPVNRTGSLSHWKIVNFQPGDDRLVLPIPQAEINVNPTIKAQQNPGYQ